MGFDPYNRSLKIRDSNSPNGSSLESVRVLSLTLSYFLGNMRCDFRASLYGPAPLQAFVLVTNPRLGCDKQNHFTHDQ